MSTLPVNPSVPVYSDGTPIPTKFLSTFAQAQAMLATLIAAGIPDTSTIVDWTTRNGDPIHGSPMTFPDGYPEGYHMIHYPGGWELCVGLLIATQGTQQGTWSTTGVYSVYNPGFIPAAPAPPPVAPIVVPQPPSPNAVWTEVGPGFFTWVTPAAAAPAVAAAPAISPALQSLLSELAALLASKGQ